MTDYSKLSDFEINFLVAEALNKFEYVSDHNAEGGSAVLCDSLRDCDTYDYCNNPSDAWPIILENDISLNSIHNCQSGICEPTGRWLAEVCVGGFSAKNKNPLRAAMIVYLMMQDELKGGSAS